MGKLIDPKIDVWSWRSSTCPSNPRHGIQACTGVPDMPLLPKQPTKKIRERFGLAALIFNKNPADLNNYVSLTNMNYIVSGDFTRIPAIRFLCLVGFGHL